jgi:hypothetical protein
MNCYFVANAQSIYYETALFQQIMAIVASEGKRTGITLKQSASFLIMTRENVKSLKEARKVLDDLLSKATGWQEA